MIAWLTGILTKTRAENLVTFLEYSLAVKRWKMSSVARLNLTLTVVHNDLMITVDKIYQFVIFKDQKYLKENLNAWLDMKCLLWSGQHHGESCQESVRAQPTLSACRWLVTFHVFFPVWPHVYEVWGVTRVPVCLRVPLITGICELASGTRG